mgnify:CR=1 FL=1
MVWGAIAAVAYSAIAAGNAANKSKKAQRDANAALKAQEEKSLGFLDEGRDASMAAAKKGITFADESFKRALGTAGTIGASTRSRILSREKTLRASADASAADRGLYHSTSALSAQRGVLESTNQALSSVDASVAQLMASIHQGRGTMGLQGYLQQAQIEQNFAMARAKVAMENQHQAASIGPGYAHAAASLSRLLMMYDWGSGASNPYGGDEEWPTLNDNELAGPPQADGNY